MGRAFRGLYLLRAAASCGAARRRMAERWRRVGQNAGTVSAALEPVFAGGMALLAEARARLADDRVTVGLDGAGRGGLSVLLLDLSTALMLLRAVAEGDMAPTPACDEAERLHLPEQVAQVLTPALRGARAPALQVVLLQVSGLAAQVLALLETLAFETTELPAGLDAVGPWSLNGEADLEEPSAPARPRLRLVTPENDA